MLHPNAWLLTVVVVFAGLVARPVESSRRRFVFAIVALGFLSAAFASAASAATHVSIGSAGSHSTIVVTGGTLERQRTDILGPGAIPGFYEVRETASPPGPPESPGTGCFSVNSFIVRCPASDVTRIEVDAGSLDDTVNIVVGVTVQAIMTGGSGNDILMGGGEDDLFPAGSDLDGSDQFYGNHPSVPSQFGGQLTEPSGADAVSYNRRHRPVTVALDAHSNDGAPGENDFVSQSVEQVSGGNVDDTLIGNDGPNTLLGGFGNDHLFGGGGADVLGGEPGDDDLHDDLDQIADVFHCDDGTDHAFLDLVDASAGEIRNCENVSKSAIDQHPNVAIKVGAIVRLDRRRRAHLPLLCPRAQQHGCAGDLTLRRGKRKVGSRHYSLRPGKRTRETFKLGASVAARAKRRHGVSASATALEKDPNGRPKTTIARFHFKGRR
jgi:Ca2+-binding RTX toxin-like protein